MPAGCSGFKDLSMMEGFKLLADFQELFDYA